MIWPFPRRPTRRPIVLFRTPWERADDGWSIAARRYTRMMQMADIDVRLWSWKPDPMRDRSVLDDFESSAQYLPQRWDVYLWSSALRDWECSSHIFDQIQQSDGIKAMHVVLERLTLEEELADALNHLDGVWAQCSANRDVLKRAGVRDVALHLHPYFDDDPWLEVPPPTEHRRFLWVGRNEPRKAPDNLVRAFMRAFSPGDAELTLKLSQYEGPAVETRATLEEVVEDQILMQECAWGWTMERWHEHIHVDRERRTRAEMVQLMASHDVYCSASRGEGLDLPAYEAKMAGRTLVLTDSGGPRDFIGDGDELVPATGEMPSSYEYYWSGAPYADYEVDALGAALERAASRAPKGDRLPGRFRAKKVAKKFGKWIKGVTRC